MYFLQFVKKNTGALLLFYFQYFIHLKYGYIVAQKYLDTSVALKKECHCIIQQDTKTK